MKLSYRAYDRNGSLVNDAIEAENTAVATEILRRQGLFVSEIREAAAEMARAPGNVRVRSRRAGGRTRRLKDMSGFVRQLSILVSTGTPMVDAISSLEQQVPSGVWKNTLSDIRQRLEQGASLSSSLEHHPAYFDAVARSLIAAGESGGQLDAMLKRLSALTRQQTRTRAMVLGAMVYPTLLISVASVVLVTMLLFVLPRFEGLFLNLGSPLPPTTKLLMDLSHLLRDRWYAALGGSIVMGVGLKMWLGSDRGRETIAVMMLRLPHFGKLVRSFCTARVLRVLGVLVEARVPLLDALRLTREAAGSRSYSTLLDRVENRVTKGESVSAALENTPLIDRNIVEAVRSGERSGALGPVLTSVADFLDEDNEVVLKSLSSVIEPLILIVLGVVIGFVAVSMFLPLFDLASATGGGAG